MNESATRYTRNRNGYLLEVYPATESAITFIAKLTNQTTGATKISGGWHSRTVAVWAVQNMYDEATK